MAVVDHNKWYDYHEVPVALLSAGIEDTPVAVPAARTPIPNSVSETIPLDFEALPV